MSYTVEMLKALTGYLLTIMYMFICVLIIVYEFIHTAVKQVTERLIRRILRHG